MCTCVLCLFKSDRNHCHHQQQNTETTPVPTNAKIMPIRFGSNKGFRANLASGEAGALLLSASAVKKSCCSCAAMLISRNTARSPATHEDLETLLIPATTKTNNTPHRTIHSPIIDANAMPNPSCGYNEAEASVKYLWASSNSSGGITSWKALKSKSLV